MDKNTLKIVSKEFYKYLDAEKGAAFNTKRAYKGDIVDFIDFVEKSTFDVVDHQTIRAYIVSIYKELKKSSLSRKVSSIKVFFKFMKRKGYIEENTALVIKNPRIEKHLPKFYTIDEMFHFLDFLPKDGWLNIRNKAIFELMYSAGMRAQEALDVNMNDIHLDGMWVKVKGKGGKERILPFGEKAKHSIEEYLPYRKQKGKATGKSPLFVNASGKRLSYRRLLKIMKKHQLKPHLF